MKVLDFAKLEVSSPSLIGTNEVIYIYMCETEICSVSSTSNCLYSDWPDDPLQPHLQ